MLRTTLLITPLFVLLSAPLLGQEMEISAQEHAKWRAQCYAQALGLDEKVTGKMTMTLEKGEEEVLELRAQVRELELRIEAAMAPHDAMVEKQLSKEERARLVQLKEKGWKACSEPCPPPANAACAPAAGKACCAGGSSAAGLKPKPAPPAPNEINVQP